MNDLIEKIKALMEDQDLCQTDIADMTGIANLHVSRYLDGGYIPDVDHLVRIAKALNTTPNYLLGFDDAKQEHEEGRLYVINGNGCIGYVESICTCDSYKERGETEIFIHCLSDGCLACIKHHQLFDCDTILNAGHSIEELSEQHSDMEMMKLFIDMYHDELLKVQAKGE